MRKIELITCGVDQLEETKAQHPHAPVFDARILPDPSEEVGDLFGTDPTVMLCIARLDPQGAIKTTNRVKGSIYEGCDTVIIFCEGGWHRSVAIAEAVAWGLKAFDEIPGAKITTTHLGAKNENC
ncbi:hypothetical protein CIP107577_00547 [Corynebacterium diphtheriae]|nr:hypothetical protein CIP107577_00547 [Corynebacterium diphtheriae]